jgi:CheY-like chemotaxis protein
MESLADIERISTGDTAYILVIEDNPGDIRLLRLALDQQDQEHELKVLLDGSEALAFVHQQRNAPQAVPRPCVIVMDLHLPKHDGVAVLEAIRKTPALAHIHVVVLTSFATALERDQASNLGVRLYREKTSDFDELIKVAQQILEICNEGRKADAA